MALTYPQIDPVAIAIGPLAIHWYGLMYLVGFGAAWLLALKRSGRAWSPVRRSRVESLVVYAAFGVIVGGRCGYVLFYNFDRWLADPLWLLRLWEGGMSFHGGLLGVVVALWLFARREGQSLLAISDFVAPLVPIGLGLGRVGNFIGQELWGRATDAPLGMIFPHDPEQLIRHPSQLYQAFFEGLVLFVILIVVSNKPRPIGVISGLFLLLYGLARFAVEFFREPDAHIGFDVLGWMTRGQLLSVPMMLVGLALVVYSLTRKRFVGSEQPRI